MRIKINLPSIYTFTKTIFLSLIIILLVGCSQNSKKFDWKNWLFIQLGQNKTYSSITLGMTLTGTDGKPLSIGNTSVKSTSEIKEDSAKPAEDSNIPPVGGGGDKAGEENLQVKFDGSAKAVEIYDSNGGYAGTITVTPRSGNESNTKSFLSFALMSEKEPAGGAISGIFHENTIVVDVPFSDISNLKMIFTHDGESVFESVVGTGQRPIQSGTSSNFSNPLPLTVKAKDGTTKDYTIIVNKIQYTCELAGIYITDYPMAKVSQKSDTTSTWYEVSLPPDANLSALKTSFSVYGTSVTVSGVTQTSGVSIQNFSSGSGVTFTAHGSNGCTQNFILKASHETLKAGAKSLNLRRNSVTRGTLDLVDIPQITKVNTIGLGKPVSMIESEAFGYFDDVDGVYHITKGQIKVMVPWATPFDKEDIIIEVETKNNAKKLTINGKAYTKGMGVRFTQKPGYEKHTIDAMLTDIYSAFEVPYEIQIVMGAPPPFLAVSKDSTFMLFVNSNAADARDEKKDLEALIKMLAPSKMGQINDLESLINYINNFQIDVARWTIDPGKVELNVIGRGFQNFDMDLNSYRQDYRCYQFKEPYESYQILLRNAKSDKEKSVLQNLAQDTHKQFCAGTKSYSTYPNFPKTAPSVGDYGKINPNLDSMEGYGVKKWLSADDIAYFFTNFMGEKPDQESNSFTVKSKKGQTQTYNLPSPNTVTYSPTEGTVGTEIYATLMAPVNPAVFNLSFTMDKIPVLNPSFEFDEKGFITAVRFNVPYISKSTRIVGERIPISGRGEKFIFYGGETFKFKPYRELKGLSYESNGFDYTVGVETKFNYPRVESGKATYYTIKSGKIPVGMIFARNVGLIYGKPVARMSPTQVVIEANDGYKQVQTTLQISASLPVVVPSPTLLYPASGYTLLSGKKFTIAPSSVGGTNVRYSIDRPLPTGFQFDRETGVFSGYPTNLMSPTTFVVRASNPVGFAIFTISFQVISDKSIYAPPTLSYSATSYTIGKGFPISFTPTFTGTAPNNFSAVGLPDGMYIDTFTGVISGTPTVFQEASGAVVTLSNYAGVSQFKISFSVIDKPPAPTNFTYPGTPFTFTTLVSTGVIKPTHTSILTSCSSSPAMPAGLVLNPNCEITGTPTVTQGTSTYSITGSNMSGSVNTNIDITIVAIPPSNLVYAGTPYTFSHNSPITTLTPSFTGNATTCTSSPALPAGLAINGTTCEIAGTPTVIQGATSYTITATNPYGNTTASISIAVAAMAPSALTYVGTPYNFYQATSSSSGTPSYSGSPFTSCTSSPSLPAGLSISSTTCTISGSPSSQQASTTYTITGSNASGSTQATIQIAIGPQPPNNLLYVGSPFMFYKNAAKTVTPTMTGTPTSCTASPTLPAGLSINNTTCAISGTATTIQDPVTYTITATNASGNTTASISIQVAIEWYRSDIKMHAGDAFSAFTTNDISIDGNNWVGVTATDRVYSGTLSGASYTIGGLTFFEDISFTNSVAISGDRMAIGLPLDSNSGNAIIYGSRPSGTSSSNSGAVLLYKKNGTNWELEAFFKASNAAPSSFYGSSVALEGDTLVVAASEVDTVYVYRRNGTIWDEEALINSLPYPVQTLRDEHSVKISGDLLGISGGSSGCWGSGRDGVVIYKRTGTTWTDTGKSIHIYPQSGYCNGEGHFDMKGDLLVYGMQTFDNSYTGVFNGTTTFLNTPTQPRTGAVWIFRWNGTDYLQEAFIKPPHNTLYVQFGTRVAIGSGDIVSVLAYSDKTSGGIYNSTPIPPDTSGNSGAIYIYRKTDGLWKWESFLKENSLATPPFYGLGPALGMYGENIVANCAYHFCFYKTR